MNGAELVLKCLKREGVDTLFGYPGGAVIPLYDALYDYRNEFFHIRTSHEQGLVHAADGYARSTGKTGVCITTSGPGATNAITGIATAYMDSTPMVIICGQVMTSMLGKDSFQEIDITGIALSVTKHNYLLRSTREIAPTIKEAFKIAQSGRKGPVLIDIPKNLFTSDIDFDPFEDTALFDIDKKSFEFEKEDETQFNKTLAESLDLIKLSKRPVIYAGGGIKSCNGEKELTEFAEKFDIPVVNTLMGLGNIDRKHPLSLGLMGMHGFKEANFAISRADLIIAVGTRFSDRGTGRCSAFAASAKIIHIEVDRSEISKNINIDKALIGSSKEILGLLNKMADADSSYSHKNWIDEIHSYKQADSVAEDEFHPKNILNLANKILEKNKKTIIVTDVGQHQMWTAQHWKFDEGRNFLTSGGLGTMGFGMGAAIGAAVGSPQKQTVLITGDGSFKMNMNELPTLSQYNIPVLILLFNNHTLGMVRQWQKMFSNKRYSETDIEYNIDYIKLANACGILAAAADSLEGLEQLLKSYNNTKPMFIQCDINKDYDVFPIVPPNDVLENLICG